MQMIAERDASINSAEWPACHLASRERHSPARRAQWISGIRPVAAPTRAVGTQRFVCPSTPLAEEVDKPWPPIDSALLTQSVPNASVF
ncbi:TPA: hypothetical protein QDC32_006769 [Burkholderia stabilis]|nr:hypothetical protein [Burkholderia stabilis]HDR9660772.1 hypothetical protein [Burkholderia stabilis]